MIMFRGQNLGRHFKRIDFTLLEHARMGYARGIDERRVGGELEDGPCAVTVADSRDLWILGLEKFCRGENGWPTLLFVVASEKIGNVESSALVWVAKCVW